MILDYNFNKSKKVLSVSYITNNGGKKILDFNVSRFKSYYSNPAGEYKNWDGTNCGIKWVEKPTSFDIKTFFEEMEPKYKELLKGKSSPKLYTFDIEVEISDEFPEPSEAKYPITTISVASHECNVIVLGTKKLEENGEQNLQSRFDKYLGDSSYFKDLNIKNPYIKYMKFDTEREMLEYFLKEIVAKVPVLAGWNSIMFDWQYIQNRLRGYYPDLSISNSSFNKTMSYKNYTDMRGDKVGLQMPVHTLILDMMDVIGNFDMVVMPIKESLSLDYIASESIGMNKIKYDGDLQKLYEEDYSTYVFYNAIDSILVQLIDKRFKTLNTIYAQSMVCREKIGSCFSKIAIAEALFFNYFYENNIKVVPTRPEGVQRGELQGAYVREPTPGKHKFVCCNDFSGLYPAVVISCNISVENYIGNDFSEDELNLYRNDKNYFVTVENCVFKNDRDYAFKNIQLNLRNSRSYSKYLSKQLDAIVMKDVESIMKNRAVENKNYPNNIIDSLNSLGYNIENTYDLFDIDLNTFKRCLSDEIMYLSSIEQAYKLCGNSCYGGSSHPAFFWYLMPLASSITAEARNTIHMMEKHIPEWFENNWLNSKELHKKLGITIKRELLTNN